MGSTVILAIFIASAATFEAGISAENSLRQASFPNSDQGMEQMGEWLAASGVSEFDQICVSGPPIGATPAFRFWSTRKAPVFLMHYGQVEQFMQKQKLSATPLEVIAKACVFLVPRQK